MPRISVEIIKVCNRWKKNVTITKQRQNRTIGTEAGRRELNGFVVCLS